MSSKFHIAEVLGAELASPFCIIETFETSDGLRTRICDTPQVWFHTRSEAFIQLQLKQRKMAGAIPYIKKEN